MTKQGEIIRLTEENWFGWLLYSFFSTCSFLFLHCIMCYIVRCFFLLALFKVELSVKRTGDLYWGRQMVKIRFQHQSPLLYVKNSGSHTHKCGKSQFLGKSIIQLNEMNGWCSLIFHVHSNCLTRWYMCQKCPRQKTAAFKTNVGLGLYI